MSPIDLSMKALRFSVVRSCAILTVVGLCNKQLACTTCSVHIKSKNEYLPEPSEEEKDILSTLEEYYEG